MSAQEAKTENRICWTPVKIGKNPQSFEDVPIDLKGTITSCPYLINDSKGKELCAITSKPPKCPSHIEEPDLRIEYVSCSGNRKGDPLIIPVRAKLSIRKDDTVNVVECANSGFGYNHETTCIPCHGKCLYTRGAKVPWGKS